MNILFIDIETSPYKTYAWELYEATAIEVLEERKLLSVAWKWYGDKKVYCKALVDMKGYKAGELNDDNLVAFAWSLMDKADLVIGHNGDEFDTKVLMGFFLRHKMRPPSYFKKKDTLKMNKDIAKTGRNNLDYLCNLYGIGKKKETDKKLWLSCIAGDMSAWKKMKTYNIRDVEIDYKLWEVLKDYDYKHPNIFIEKSTTVCPTCGSSQYYKKGYDYTKLYTIERLVCTNCGKQRQGGRTKR